MPPFFPVISGYVEFIGRDLSIVDENTEGGNEVRITKDFSLSPVGTIYLTTNLIRRI